MLILHENLDISFHPSPSKYLNNRTGALPVPPLPRDRTCFLQVTPTDSCPSLSFPLSSMRCSPQ